MLRQQFAGSSNAGSLMYIDTDSKENAPDITPIPQNGADGYYSSVNDMVMQKIITAHRITSPMMFGIKEAGQLGGRAEVIDAFLLLLNQVIKPSRDTVNISVNNAGVEHNLCTVENRIEGTVNFNISGLLQNIGPHINQRFHATTIQWNTISYTSLIVQLYSIFRDQTPNKLVSMSINKARHLRVQGIAFEYTLASMQTLVNNLTLAELGRMEDAVIVTCRQGINVRTPWIVNQDPIRNTFTNADSAWSPAQNHNAGVKVIGPGAGGVIAI
jgi:hypothetical protein